MLVLFEEGGFPMWFLLAFSVLTLVFAARFAMTPSRRTLRITGALSAAVGFTTITGVATDLATVGHQAPDFLAHHPEMTLAAVILQGIAESLAPAILGFTVLSVKALLVAYGFHREAAE
jgi:hypothetical protein